MAKQEITCGLCDKEIQDTVEDMYQDDSGEYHQDCHYDATLAEQSAWAKVFAPKSFREHVSYDPRDAYEINDPKHPDFLDWADLQRDIARGK